MGTDGGGYEVLPALILPLDSSIRFCAVTNRLGYISASKYRLGLKPLMDVEETEKYALSASIRHSTRKEWESKIGEVMYTITRYEKLIRATIPLPDNCLLLLSIDIGTKNVVELLMDKILPAVRPVS